MSPRRGDSWPIRVMRALLARVLGGHDDALGDLDEELGRRPGAGGRGLPSTLWYLKEGTSLLAGAVRHAAGRRFLGGTGLALDTRAAYRGLRARPGLAAVLVLTVALSVGATTAVFGLLRATWLAEVPYAAPDRLVRVYTAYENDPANHSSVSPLTWSDLQRQDAVLDEVGVWTIGETVHLVGDGEPRRLVAPRASAGLFRLAGLEPAAGRWLTEEDLAPGRDDVVVLSHAWWVEAFGAAADVVGRRLLLDDRSYEVVGVAPPAFALPADADLWRPLALEPVWFTPERRGWEYLATVARLAPGVTPDEATRRLSADFARQDPDRAGRLGQMIAATSFRADRLGPTGPALLLLTGAVGLLLLMACLNVMGVLAARAESRGRELAMRRALGAGGGRLLRGVLAEAALLAGAGGMVGLAGAALFLSRAGGLPGVHEAAIQPPTLDPLVGTFTLGLLVVTALLFAAAPAARALSTQPASVLGAWGVGAGGGRTAGRLRRMLVMAQVAVALVLVTGVVLSGRAFAELVGTEPGFRTDGVVTATLELPADVTEHAQRRAFYDDLLARVRSLPGVEAAGLVNGLPLEGTMWSASFQLADAAPAVDRPEPGGNMRAVSPDYFRALEIAVLEGRVFEVQDDERSVPVVVVDETLARRYWPGESPVGRQVVAGALSTRPATVVGVVADVPDQGLHAPSSGHLYFPVRQRALRRTHLVVRSSGDPLEAVPGMRTAVEAADPRVPLFDVGTLEARLASSLAGPRLAVTVLAAFGALALLLAALGVYGVLSHAVTRRRREIGTRIALGANPSSVTAGVVREALAWWLVGAGIGSAGAVVAAGALERVSLGVVEPGPLPFAVSAGILALAALLAAAGPALRAARLDPAETLKED